MKLIDYLKCLTVEKKILFHRSVGEFGKDIKGQYKTKQITKEKSRQL